MLVIVLARPDLDFLEAIRQLPVEVKISADPGAFTPEDLARAEVVVNYGHQGDRLLTVWPGLKSVRWIHSLSAGVEGLMFDALRESPIPLTNARGVYRKALGEWTMLAMLFFAKDVRRLLRQQGEETWQVFDCLMLEGATVAIIGYGEIGRDVARRAKSFGMRVIATRRRVPSEPDEFADEVLPSSENLAAIARADYLVLCSPLTAETRGMIGAREFAAMKPTGVFINIGRGAVVDEAALVEALRDRRIAGAALDVFETEPLPKGHPLWGFDNLLLSPHCADHTATWQHESVDFFVENFQRYQRGEPLMNIVDKQAGY
jgi:phosphoglycerate dehydrogenase-like enzyme